MREERSAGASAASDWRFAVLYESARALAEADTRADAIPRILKAICEALDWEHAALWDIDPDAEVLRCTCMWHVASVRFEALEAISQAVSLSRGVGLPGRVWASAEPVWLSRVRRDASFPRALVARRESLRSSLGVPILSGGEVRGVMEFFSREIREPDQSLLELLRTIGSQIGMLIERKRAQEDLARHARELEIAQTKLQHELRVASELLLDARRRVEAALLGDSVSVRALRESLAECARSAETVLLTGEPGAGHEAVARAIHHESDRQERAFIHVNCGIAADHLESSWFTFRSAPVGDGAQVGKLALAGGGTLYLESIERLPVRLQSNLADLLLALARQRGGEPGSLPDVRVLASSREDLTDKSQQGRFDPRLAEIISNRILRVPSLAERKDDIPVLVDHFIRTHAQRLGSLVSGVSPESLRRLCKYRWPGNITELESLIERAIVTARAPLLDIDPVLLEEGVSVGQYRLLKKIGQGGMGEVWLAKHQLLAQPAAVKLIRQDSTEIEGHAGTLARFRREAEATARLTSSHTVRLYDFGVSHDGTCYHVMELLRGLDLGSMLARFGPLPPERVTNLLGQACRSLSEAHDAGLVHRDIKPANLFVCRLGNEYDCLKVLDFGIVKNLDDRATATATKMMAGTPAFIAPDVVRGDPIGPSVDIYSLGCVAWCMLTGRNLFTGELAQILTDHVNTEPEPPSRYARAAISPELDEIVLQCLNKKAEHRPASARDLGLMFDAVAMAEPWTQDRAEAWWRTHVPELTQTQPFPQSLRSMAADSQ